LIFGGSGKKAVLSSSLNAFELKSLTTDVAVAMNMDALSAGQIYAIQREESEWLHDPFYEKKTYREMLKYKETAKAIAETGKKITFDYTGYLEFSDRKVAIINGIEYFSGDVLETPGYSGYILRAISPGKVVIENKADKIKIEVPIQD
jgi:hypothetical protein